MIETVLGVAAGIIAALLAILSGIVAQLYGRVTRLESYNRDLWAYTRRVLDLYYRHRQPGAPDPDPLPDGDG